MLPSPLKITSSSDFRLAVRRGTRAGSRTLVVHVFDTALEFGVEASANSMERKTSQLARFGGPRFGLVVSKSVGNAVTRHAVSRKLRNAALALLTDDASTAESSSPQLQLNQTHLVVIRALPASATATSDKLQKDLSKAMRRALSRG